MKTRQQIFDIVSVHLLTQNEKSTDAATEDSAICHIGCAYRVYGTDLKCAVGCMIPDDKYDPAWEGAGLQPLAAEDTPVDPKHDQIVKEILAACDVSLVDQSFVASLQWIHDARPVENWPHDLQQFAIKHMLEMPALLKERLQPK